MLPPNEDPPKRASRVNLSKIESAHLIVAIELHSDEAQHAFRRRFDRTQLNLHQLLVHGFNRLPHRVVAEAEQLLRLQLDASTAVLDGAIAEAECSLRSAGITDLGSYRRDPLVEPVMVFSGIGKRYLALICKFDVMMVMLEKKVIHGLISTVEMEQQKTSLKKELRHVAYLARDLASACEKSASALSRTCSDRVAGGTTGPDRAGSRQAGPPSSTGAEPAD